MVDSQATGLGNRIKQIGALLHKSNQSQWELTIAEELAQLALVIHSYRAIDTLPAALQADIRSAIGWNTSQDDVSTGEAVDDVWQVIATHTRTEDKMTIRANYIQGARSHRIGMLLQFGIGSQPLPPPLMVGSYRSGAVYFYPSATPLRVVFSPELQPIAAASTDLGPSIPPAQNIPSLLTNYAELLAHNPLVEQYPFVLRDVTLLSSAGKWLICPRDGAHALRVAATFSNPWKLMSLAGGHEIDVFGLWDGDRFMPLSATVSGVIYNLEESHA